MQTFLPFEDFQDSARSLDNKRLGKQRVEAKQIYLALTKKDYGWKNHPAVLMWKGHEFWLTKYGRVICEEWIARGFNDTLTEFFVSKRRHELKKIKVAGIDPRVVYPPWLGDERLHRSHQMNLLRKDFSYYSQQFNIDEYLKRYSELDDLKLGILIADLRNKTEPDTVLSLFTGYFWPTKSPDYNPDLLFDNTQQKS